MFTWGSKYLFSLSFLSWLSALVYGVSTGGHIVGALSAGYKNGVGEHFGYTILLGYAVVFLFLGLVAALLRDGIIQDAEGNQLSANPVRPVQPSYWPALAGFAAASLVAGFAFSRIFLIAGLVLLFVVVVEWALLSWSEGVSGDPLVNVRSRNRVLAPFDVPLFSLLLLGFVVIAVSRILVAVPVLGSSLVALIAGAGVFGGAIFLAKSNVSKSVMRGIVVVGALVVLIGGIVAAAFGERDFHHHDSEHPESVDKGAEL